jgi:hypothetical protein
LDGKTAVMHPHETDEFKDMADEIDAEKDSLVEIFDECHGLGKEYIINRICALYPLLDGRNKAFKTDLYKRIVQSSTIRTDKPILRKAKTVKASKKKGREAVKPDYTVEDFKAMEDDNGDKRIKNYVVQSKLVNETSQERYIEVWLEDGKIKEEFTEPRSIPRRTAPSLEFYKCEYESLNALYAEIRNAITNYISFPTDSIYPDLIALGCMASYFREVFFSYPFYDYISAEVGYGKTTAMRVQTYLSFYGTTASSFSEAVLFREIDSSHCFYGLDNVERLFISPRDNQPVIDWLLSSYSRGMPCKRLMRTETDFIVAEFDGFGIKAFTHTKEYPHSMEALRSRSIQIIMQKGFPAKDNPGAEKFTEIRDTLYKARLYEFEAVKESYDALVASQILRGRTGELFNPLLSIAKLVDTGLYEEVLKYTAKDEEEREAKDEWNKILVQALFDNGLTGSHSTHEIKGVFEEALINADFLKNGSIYTRSIGPRLKNLGFRKEDRRSKNKTWYLIDAMLLMHKAYDYHIITEEELKSCLKSLPDTEGLTTVNLQNFVNPKNSENEEFQRAAETDREGEAGTLDACNGTPQKGVGLGRLTRLTKRGVCQEEKTGLESEEAQQAYNNKFIIDSSSMCNGITVNAKNIFTHTPQTPNLPNLPNPSHVCMVEQEGIIAPDSKNEVSSAPSELHMQVEDLRLTRNQKLTTVNPTLDIPEEIEKKCASCGIVGMTTKFKGEWLCDKCLGEASKRLVMQKANDEDFQAQQATEAKQRMEAERRQPECNTVRDVWHKEE